MLTGLLPFQITPTEKRVFFSFNERTHEYKLISKRSSDGAVITRRWTGIDAKTIQETFEYKHTSVKRNHTKIRKLL